MIEKKIKYKVLNATAVTARIREVRESDKYPKKLMYICDLLDADGKVLAADRYVYDDLFIEFQPGDFEYVQEKEPDKTWDIEPIKFWFQDRQIKDENGTISKDDPYYFEDTITKIELLEKLVVFTEKVV